MVNVRGLPFWACAGLLAMGSLAQGQTKPYIGYVYPAGGRQATTVALKIGGQGLNDVDGVLVTGAGVSAKVIDCYRQMGNTEQTLLREQLKELKPDPKKAPAPVVTDAATARLIERIQKRLDEFRDRPACASISNLAFLEVVIAPDAEPGARELRLVTPGGVSNPLPFHVGQVPECSRKPMLISNLQVLGKEEQALRTRPADEAEQRITVPCIANGQVAPGEVNWYRFEARQGQRLVLSTAARQLVPYIADAVPGWFQPVLAVYDAGGNELAYNDDFRFKPDPTLCFEVPRDGEYRFAISDAIYRGREDFVYRVTIGELPYVTSLFPLGGPAGAPGKIEMKGWNLEKAVLVPLPADAGPGVHGVAAIRDGLVSNRVPFALDTLPECLETEPNDSPSNAQLVQLPVIVNGRMDRAKDKDVFQVVGYPGDTIVAEVMARRLDSPLDSMLKVTDSDGALLAFNDDHLDPAAGIHTHHADSYLTAKLPADGTCFVHLTDTARQGGEAYAYRLRLSSPRPDFALRVVPSSVTLRSKATASLTVFAIRTDGFAGDIKLGLKAPPAGFEAPPVVLAAGKESAKLTVKTGLTDAKQPVNLVVEGRAKIGDREVVHEAVPAEDRMQAFLWRHLVPAEDLKTWVFNPDFKPPPKRVPPPRPVEKKDAPAASSPANDMMDMASSKTTAPPADGMQDMASSKTTAPPAAGKQDKPAPAAPTPPAARKEDKPAPVATAPPAAVKQDKPATPAPTPPAAGKEDKPAPAAPAPPAAVKQDKPATPTPAPPAAGKEDKAAPAAPTPPTTVKQDKPATPAPAPPAAGKQDKPAPEKAKFTKQQVESRLRRLKILYEDWLLTDDFYFRKVAECEIAQ